MKPLREPIVCRAKTALHPPAESIYERKGADMSQLRPLALIIILAWSLVVCLGVSAQSGSNVAYIAQPGDLNTAT